MLLVAAVSLLSAPAPINFDQVISSDNLPEYLIEKGGGSWVVGVRLNVGSDGVLKGCDVEISSGIALLDKQTCGTLQRRAQFKPAVWTDGTPVIGVYRTAIRFVVNESTEKPPGPIDADLELSVSAMPRGVHSPATVGVMFAVGSDGRISDCALHTTSPLPRPEKNPVLVATACDQVLQNYKAIAARGVDGKPVRSVQNATVRFTIQKP